MMVTILLHLKVMMIEIKPYQSKERMAKFLVPFTNKCNWKGINYPSGQMRKSFKKHVKKMNIYPSYISKHKLNHEDQIIF